MTPTRFEQDVLRAMASAEEAAIFDRPCICGEPHAPSTDCYMRAFGWTIRQDAEVTEDVEDMNR
jgi:hypothetical protein